ncbi:unnamed protein product [Auanema sp. JU1783]|nr:unnamed protein product [Auanema sp. JU1783]
MRIASLVGICFLVTCCYGSTTELEAKVVDAIDKAVAIVYQRNNEVVGMKGEQETQKANMNSQLEQMRGDLFAEITRILIEENGEEILSELEEVDINTLLVSRNTRSKRYANEPARSTTSCTPDDSNCRAKIHDQYRTVTGICNNKQNRLRGTSVSPVRRLLRRNSYSDGVGALRTKARSGALLPSTRHVSNVLHDEGTENNYDLKTNHLHMQFGQFIAHDIIFMPSSTAPSGDTLDCKLCNSSRTTPNCAPIPVPFDDAYFPKNSCIRLTRALNGQKGLGARVQLNQNTHLLDLSAVYGSEECEAASLRTFTKGELKDYKYSDYTLPPQSPNDTNCQSKNPNYCFLAGDFRNSLHPGLIPLHTVYIKEHNRIARELAKRQTRWSDETLFQETRRIVIAQYQHHVYSFYLPKLLGRNTMDRFDLTPKTRGETDYDDKLNPSVTAEFAGAAFRFGHSQARKDLVRKSNTNTTLGKIGDLGENFFYSDVLYEKNVGGTESLLEGMIRCPAMRLDSKFSFPMRNQLFETRGKKASGVDLVAVNLMRGRDLGLLPYNDYREVTGRRRANKWDDLKADMSASNIQALKTVYEQVDDIDLYAAIVSEGPSSGAMIGETGQHIIAETFSALKFGDRFYYEHEDNLDSRQLQAIRATSLNKVLCENSPNMEKVLRNIFDLDSDEVRCDSLKNVDLEPFL